MRVFLMHVGHPGNIDINYTVTRKRTIKEIVNNLPSNSPERNFFEENLDLHSAFPDGSFNCWGVPSGAEPSFTKTQIGDLVLFAPSIGDKGSISQLGIVRAKVPFSFSDTSHILWPDTPRERLYPLIFFFNAELGHRGWHEFLSDAGIRPNWDPKGWYRPIKSERFSCFGGPSGYLDFLRKKCGFKQLLY